MQQIVTFAVIIGITLFVQLVIILNYMAEAQLDRCHSAIKARSLES